MTGTRWGLAGYRVERSELEVPDVPDDGQGPRIFPGNFHAGTINAYYPDRSAFSVAATVALWVVVAATLTWQRWRRRRGSGGPAP